MVVSIILVIVGFIFLIKGADFLVSGASAVAKRFKISEMVIGLTIIAMGTSMPELMVSLTSALDGHSDIALGNVVGSNLANVLLILGICALMSRINIPKETRRIENPLCLIITITLVFLCLNGSENKMISQPEGILLLVLFAIYLIYLFMNAKKKEEPKDNEQVITKTEGETEAVPPSNNVKVAEEKMKEKTNNIQEKTEKKSKTLKTVIIDCLKIIVGIIALKFGADFVVDNAVNIAEIIGISEKIIGVTIIAIGTSLPELVASITAVMKGENDMAVGNIVGSNIFNILLILGVSSAISPINYALSYNFDMIFLVVTCILMALFPYIGKSGRALDRAEGIIFVTMYLAYILILLFVL